MVGSQDSVCLQADLLKGGAMLGLGNTPQNTSSFAGLQSGDTTSIAMV